MQLQQAQRVVEAFAAANRYQGELKGLTLSMIGYMEDFW